MFRDLKEYQDITKIYQDSVHISEEERIITQIIREENFTQEELDYVIENFDEIYDNEVLTEEFFDEMEGEYLEEMAVAKKAVTTVVKKVVPKVTKGVKKVVEKGAKQMDLFKDTAKNVKPVVKKSVEKVGNTSKKLLPKEAKPKGLIQKGKDAIKSAVTKFKSGVKKVVSNPTVQKVAKTAVRAVPGLALAGGLAVGAKKLLDRGKKTEKTTPAPEKKPEIRKIDPKQFDSRRETKPEVTTEKPVKKMHSIEKKNRARLGDAKVDALKAKNADFKKMRKGEMSKADFIKAYPKSITAQKAAGLRDHTEWDAYDMVLEYLYSTEQVTSLEEANYVMMEMEQQTIGEIVKEVKESLIDEGLAKMALKTGAVVGGAVLAKKGLDKAKKSFDNYLNKQRDKGIGGNTRPGSDKMYYGDKK